MPTNTTATLYLPSMTGSPLTEGGQAVDSVTGVKLLRRDADRAVLSLVSGQYEFESWI